VAVTCRVLKLARQPYYRWRAHPITGAEIVEAYRANALFDAHGEDPEFGYRYLVEEARDAGEPMAARTGWRICTDNKWWSVFGKKRGKNGKVGPPVHDDLVERDFTADEPNQLWLSDITEHRTGEGKLYLLVTWNHAGGLLFVPRCHPELRGPVHCVGDLGREVAGLAASRAGVGVAADLGRSGEGTSHDRRIRTRPCGVSAGLRAGAHRPGRRDACPDRLVHKGIAG